MANPPYLVEYYLITLGFHLQKTYKDITERDALADVYEVILHHLVTFSLYIGAYLLGFVKVATLAVYVLDVPEIFVSMSKAFSESKF